MTTATPIQSYATIAEADVYLKLKSTWIDLSDDDKEDALLWARYFIDAKFDCTIDMDAIADEVKYANSILAYDYHIQGDLFFDNSTGIRSKKVKAGKTETEKHFTSASKEGPNSLSKVTAILKTVCNKTSGNLTRV